ncbi:hypothetical protein P4I85_22515 [Bacillus cereus]|nr:hypothetical protein [Bacillus cereus]MEB9511343.1 hypothetical protein [Bacillus cereus]MEB9563232.1 hypothetical protein [Bacillus cereus]
MKKYQVEVEVKKTYKALVEVEIPEEANSDDFQRLVEEKVESMDQEKLDYQDTSHFVLKLNGPDPVAISKTEEGTYKRILVEMHYSWDMIKDWSEEKCEAEIEAIDGADVI